MVLNEQINAQKTISILGSTGSIGKNTLDLISLDSEKYKIELLSCLNNYKLLAQQALEFNPKKVVLGNPDYYKDLKELLTGTNIEIFVGRKALIDCSAIPVDWVMSAIVGIAGLEPSIAAVKQGTTVALANKECLVSAGDLFMSELPKSRFAELAENCHNGSFSWH